jgi:mRNA interferase MazF
MGFKIADICGNEFSNLKPREAENEEVKKMDNNITSFHQSPYQFMHTVRKGDIFWAELTTDKEIVGSEQAGEVRPVVIVQNNFGNTGPTVIVAKLTGAEHDKNPLPTNILIRRDSGNGLKKDSIVLLNQIVTIDKIRLIQKMGSITPEQLNAINKGILISFGIDVLYLI